MTDSNKPGAFKIEIGAPHAFRALCEAIGQVLAAANFRVVVEEQGFHGLRLNSIDNSTICCVNAQFKASVTGSPGRFCVDTKMLLTFLKAVDSSSVLHMSRAEGANHLTLESQDRGGTARCYEVPLIVDRDTEEQQLSDMDTKYTMRMGSSDFTRFVNMCHALKASYIQFSIRTMHTQPGEEDKYCTMMAEGEGGGRAGETRVHRAAMRDSATIDVCPEQPGRQENTTCAAPRDAKVNYQEIFSREYLYRFCRNIDSPTVQFGFCGARSPLIMSFELGQEESHVRFVLAPMNDDDDDM